VIEYDMIVVGSGAGMNVASSALGQGLRVAVAEHGLMGGTCLNTGCIPSKILLYPADVIRELEDAAAVGVMGRIHQIDFPLILQRARSFVREGRDEMEQAIKQTDQLKVYRDTVEFVGDYTLRAGQETITAPKIVIASGSRPLVPAIPGLAEAGYIDNVSLLELDKPPESLIIIGGGYIACEYGHFFSAMGSVVTILGRNPRLLKGEEPEISAVVERRFARYAIIRTNHEVLRVERRGRKKVVTARDRGTGQTAQFEAREIMLAVGRRSNADLLKPERTGVETDQDGWIKVNPRLETSKPNIWALGDALGKFMYRHTANAESEVVAANVLTEHKHQMDYHAVPHAVFGYPQVAAVGITEAQATEAGFHVLVGRARYTDVTKGYAMAEPDSLVKVIVDGETRRILGCHIAGSHAAILVQQIAYLMNAGDQDYYPIADSQIIHPALSEVVVNALANLAPPGHAHHHHHEHEQGDGHPHDE